MPGSLTFLHTSPVHVATFDRLVAQLAPDLAVQHVVDESLLAEARANGLTPALHGRIQKRIQQAFHDDALLVVCTCSTIGGLAEQIDRLQAGRVMRIDRPMAEQAVRMGQKILIVAAVASTIAPTRALLETIAVEQRRSIQIDLLLCEAAWSYFEHGQHDAYLATLAECIRSAAQRADLIVLAQASMAGVVQLCSDVSVPILSSPLICVQAALKQYYSLSCSGMSAS